jgi:predicted DsbA family dithiol-disulfide isomerase
VGRKRGKGRSVSRSYLSSLFCGWKNIGKIDELVDIAKSIGLPEEEARSVLKLRPYEEAVDSDWRRSSALGINAVPTFVVDHQAVIGFQSYEVLEQFLKNCGAERFNP